MGRAPSAGAPRASRRRCRRSVAIAALRTRGFRRVAPKAGMFTTATLSSLSTAATSGRAPSRSGTSVRQIAASQPSALRAWLPASRISSTPSRPASRGSSASVTRQRPSWWRSSSSGSCSARSTAICAGSSGAATSPTHIVRAGALLLAGDRVRTDITPGLPAFRPFEPSPGFHPIRAMTVAVPLRDRLYTRCPTRREQCGVDRSWPSSRWSWGPPRSPSRSPWR